MARKRGKQFNKIEEKILRVLYKQKVYLSVYEVAKACGISYPTAKKYLYSLAKRGYIRLRGK
jgi:DNA-binding IclR family transcriptional regulator